MAYTIRVSLPGYNALTDTDLDHYALFVDSSVDYTLIKEYTRGSASISPTFSTPYPVSHNLGYVPFFLVYVFDGTHWTLTPNFQTAVVAPYYYANSDSNNLEIWNFTGSNATFKWYIFYDNITSGNPSFSESNYVVKVSKIGHNALTTTNPNNFIFHSDLNTFKILKEETASVTYTSNGEYSINHNMSGYSPTSFLLFCKFPDGYTALVNGTFYGNTMSRDTNWIVSNVRITPTQIKLNIERLGGNATNLSFKYYIFETPL
jgi:hypothetical protein